MDELLFFLSLSKKELKKFYDLKSKSEE